MKKFLLVAVAAIGLMSGAVAPALADYYEGGWYVRNNEGGREILYLGDNSDNTYLALRGTGLWCGSRGDSYARMRQVIGNEHNQISWWDTNNCADSRYDYVRVCVSNSRGQQACSTYINNGWVDGNSHGGVAMR